MDTSDRGMQYCSESYLTLPPTSSLAGRKGTAVGLQPRTFLKQNQGMVRFHFFPFSFSMQISRKLLFVRGRNGLLSRAATDR